MAESGTRSASCLCGAVRFAATPKDPEISACHCSMCRKWTAGPFLAVDCGSSVKVENKANLGVYRSSAWAERCFCRQCGSALFYRLIESDLYFVSVEAFDERGGFQLTTQVFIDDKPPYYAFANATTNMTGAEVFAAFMGGQAKG
jgi:hypothetical protein